MGEQSPTKEQSPTPTRGVPIMLDRERRLRYSLKTVRELKKEFGEGALSRGVGEDGIAKLLWYGLKSDDPELSCEDVEELVDLEHLTEVMEKVSIATGSRSQFEMEEEPDKATDKKPKEEAGNESAEHPPEPALVQETSGAGKGEDTEVDGEKVADS